MSRGSNRLQLSQRDRDEFTTQQLRVRPLTVALRMWEDMLTEEDKRRLGGDLEHAWRKYDGTVGIWMWLRGVSQERAIIDVAAGTGHLEAGTRARLLRRLGEPEDDADRKIDSAISTASLVLIAQPRQAFWHGRSIEIDWERYAAVWSFFWELSRCSKRSQPITHFELGENSSSSVLSTRKGRLVNAPEFPEKLSILIEAAMGGGYVIKLPSQEIRLFEDRDGVLTEVFG